MNKVILFLPLIAAFAWFAFLILSEVNPAGEMMSPPNYGLVYALFGFMVVWPLILPLHC